MAKSERFKKNIYIERNFFYYREKHEENESHIRRRMRAPTNTNMHMDIIHALIDDDDR